MKFQIVSPKQSRISSKHEFHTKSIKLTLQTQHENSKIGQIQNFSTNITFKIYFGGLCNHKFNLYKKQKK